MGPHDPDDKPKSSPPPGVGNPIGDVGSRPAAANPVKRDMVFHQMRAANGLVKLLDRTGRIIFANKPCRDALGRLITNGQYWWDLWPSDTHPQVIDALRRASRGKTATFTAFRTVKGNSPSWWHVTMQGMSTETGDIDMILVTSCDVGLKAGAISVMQRI